MPNGWTAHTLRHRMASVSYAGTRDLLAVGAVLGHSRSAQGVDTTCMHRYLVCMAHTPNLLPSAEVCALLSIDRSTLSRWVQLGRVTVAVKAPGVRGAMFFTPEEVERVKAEAAA